MLSKSENFNCNKLFCWSWSRWSSFLTAYTKFFLYSTQWIFKSSNLHFINHSSKNQCSGIFFWKKVLLIGGSYTFAKFFAEQKKIGIQGSVSVFCLLSQISSVLINTTVNCQGMNLKTALLWLLSFRWEFNRNHMFSFIAKSVLFSTKKYIIRLD